MVVEGVVEHLKTEQDVKEFYQACNINLWLMVNTAASKSASSNTSMIWQELMSNK